MKALCIIDMQHDFISGALGSEAARAIVPRVAERARRALALGERLVFTRDTHSQDYLSTQEGRYLPVKHCVYGTHGWQIARELEPFIEGALVIDKPAFGSMALAERIRGMGDVSEVELCGLCTDICVISNAMILKAALPEARVCVNARLCAGATKQGHEIALSAMKACQIDILQEGEHEI